MLPATILSKTEAGQRVLKDRSLPLAPRQRSAFILFDGKRTLGEVLAATVGMGLEEHDVQTLLDAGVLQVVDAAMAPVRDTSLAVRAPVSAGPMHASMGAVAVAASGAYTAVAVPGRSSQQRYRDAYAIATELTASLGLRGFRLNLAVEGAGGLEDLRTLGPKIRDAVGPHKYARLDQALNA